MNTERIVSVIFILVFLGVIALTIWWGVYKYHDCIRVGHTVTYCVVDQFF